jgi:hypothetical protein
MWLSIILPYLSWLFLNNQASNTNGSVAWSSESGRDKRYYEHVMKDFHEQYDSVGQTSQYKDNDINTPSFT